MNFKQRNDILVLNGPDATVDGNNLSFQMQPYMFAHHKPNDIMTIRLVDCSFSPDINAWEETVQPFKIIANLNVKNQYNTSSRTLLGNVLVHYSTNGTNHKQTSGQFSAPPRAYECEPFTEITFSAYSANAEKDISTKKEFATFVLEVEYFDSP